MSKLRTAKSRLAVGQMSFVVSAAQIGVIMSASDEQISSCKVLFICDDLDKGTLIEHILRERNDKVRYAAYSREVLIEAGQNPPDIIIIDHSITDTDSFEVYRQLREKPTLQNVPVLFEGAAIIR